MKLKKSLLAAGLAAMLTVSACSATEGGSSSQIDENRVVYYSIGPNDGLDPLTVINGNSYAQATLMAVYDRLLDFDENGNLIPGLAESWEFTDESLTTFELKLREGVTFHDGESLDAAAVVANLERTIELKDNASAAVQQAVREVTAVEAVDDYSVRIQLANASSSLPFGLAQMAGMMMSPASFANGEAGTEIAGIGAGPYIVEEDSPDNYTKLVVNEEYWNGGVEDRASKLEIHNVQDGQTRLNALRSGQADIISLDTSMIEQARSADLEVMTFDSLSVWMNYLNTGGILQDKRIRQALMYATDRELIADNLSSGVNTATNQVFPPNYPVFNTEDSDEYSYSVERAKELLSEAGYEDGVELHFILLNLSEVMSLFEAIQQMWAEAGITLKVTTIDTSQSGDFINGSMGDMLMAGWGGRADPQETLQLLASTGGTYAPAGATNPLIDELLQEARGIDPNDPRRMEVLKETSRLVMEEASVIPFNTRPTVYASKQGCIEGLEPYPAIVSGYWANITKTDQCR